MRNRPRSEAVRSYGWYRVTTSTMCCGVEVEEGVIIRTAPILRKFIGQDLMNLIAWIGRLGGSVDRLKNLP